MFDELRLKLPQVGTDLHAGDGFLMFWSHVPIAPWQNERWIADMRRSLRPNQFLIENKFVTTGQPSSSISLGGMRASIRS